MPKRIQMTRQRPWRNEHPDAVIVARPTEWGNPISLVDVGGQYPSLDTDAVARLVVQDFRALANHGSLSFPNWRHAGGGRGPVAWTYPSLDRIRVELGGRDLACWCGLDQACHADVLLEHANTPSDRERQG